MSQSLGPPLRLVTFSLFPCLFAYPQRVSEKRRPLCGCCSCSFLPKMYTFYSQFNLTISRFRFPARPFAFSRFLGSREPGRELSAQVNLCARTQLDTKSSAVDSGIASRGSRLAPVAGSLIVVPGLGFGFLPTSLGVPLSRLRPLDKPHNPAPFFDFPATCPRGAACETARVSQKQATRLTSLFHLLIKISNIVALCMQGKIYAQPEK